MFFFKCVYFCSNFFLPKIRLSALKFTYLQLRCIFLQITKEKAAAIVDRLCPSSANHGIKNKFISLAEESKKFFATPERFRSRSTVKARSSSVDALFKRKRSPSPAVKRAIFATEPQSPRLLTRERSRSKVVQPSEQQPPPELK